MTCNKAAFATRRAAKAEADLIARRKAGRLRIYQCQLCGQFHLTSWSKRQERERRRDLRKQQEIQEEVVNADERS